MNVKIVFRKFKKLFTHITLFISMPKREYEISDLYVMALSFLIFFAVGKIVKSVVEKQQRQLITMVVLRVCIWAKLKWLHLLLSRLILPVQ
jgi:hypothetical protein